MRDLRLWWCPNSDTTGVWQHKSLPRFRHGKIVEEAEHYTTVGNRLYDSITKRRIWYDPLGLERDI